MRYFLGSHTPEGFFSYYTGAMTREDLQDVFLIKGSPGCGKSTFMRIVAETLGDADTQYVCCASDPDSLDAVLFPSRGAAVVDATSPHVCEPKLPIVVERYVDLSAYVDPGPLRQNRASIAQVIAENQACYRRLDRCLQAVSALENELFDTIVSGEGIEKIRRRAQGIISREIRRPSGAGGQGRIRDIFLSALTPQGQVCRFDTADACCQRIYELEDTYGLGHFMLSQLRDAASDAGYTVYAGHAPLQPQTRLEHVLIPELSLGFVTSGGRQIYPGEPYRRVRLDAMIAAETMRRHKSRLRFLRKTHGVLLDEAVGILCEAKAHHDVLEAYYNPCVNFEAVRAHAHVVAKSLQSQIAKKT